MRFQSSRGRLNELFDSLATVEVRLVVPLDTPVLHSIEINCISAQ